MHALHGLIPRGAGHNALHCLLLRFSGLFRQRQGLFTGGDKGGVILDDGNNVAIRFLDIGNGGADHRQLRGHVLQHLCRANESCGFIQRERHQAHIPAGKKLWQGLVRLHAAIMNVAALGQGCGIDLHYRADHHDLPLRMRVRQGGNQR